MDANRVPTKSSAHLAMIRANHRPKVVRSATRGRKSANRLQGSPAMANRWLDTAILERNSALMRNRAISHTA